MLHGGQFHVYYSRSKTTHIIANNLPNTKIQELKGEKVIRPEWITDRCVPFMRGNDLHLETLYCGLCALDTQVHRRKTETTEDPSTVNKKKAAAI